MSKAPDCEENGCPDDQAGDDAGEFDLPEVDRLRRFAHRRNSCLSHRSQNTGPERGRSSSAVMARVRLKAWRSVFAL
jgi:hypothetical protein